MEERTSPRPQQPRLFLDADVEIPAVSADNRVLFGVPRQSEESSPVELDLLPRVRYRLPRDAAPSAAAPFMCFESGVLVCPDKDGEGVVVMNLSDRVATIRSGDQWPYMCDGPSSS